jgi:amidohydrolase
LNVKIDQLVSLRHWLHAHPEISRCEVETAKHIRGFLDTYAKPDDIITLDGAGFAAIYDGKAPGNTVLFRCELDALPIHEINDDIAYRSVNDGVGHKCGHDGHMAILAGVAQTLTERPANGRVVLLFQPDEETGTGARQCCLHEGFKTIQPDYAFALHNLPGYPAGDVICKPGTFASEVKYAAIKMVGVEAHSAQPETGVSPSFALAELTLRARTIQKRYDHPDAYALVIPVYNHMGVQASGVCPARGEVHFTLRSALGATVEKMWQDLTSCAENIAESFGLRVEFETREEFAATTNHQSGFDMIQQAAAMTGHAFTTIDSPFRWGEDFGELTKRYTGGMFGLGAGLDRPNLHNPDYDFPDEILTNGIAVFVALIDIATKSRGGGQVDGLRT